ncbi:glycosyltransferase family protein [Jejubacter calystegiae]|nr:glycosyltransferase [Jejubacter calystegiae]
MCGYRPARLAFYSHDTMGLGHIRRNMLLANAVLKRRPSTEILLINGIRESGIFHFPEGMDSVTLPGYRKMQDGKYRPSSLGHDIHRLVELRVNVIQAALTSFRPDVMVVDNVPRGAMSELDSILPMLARQGTHLVLGLRDIIDEPTEVQRQWRKLDNQRAIRDYYHDVWVYGDARFYDLRSAYQLEKSVVDKTSFMGYLNATYHAPQPQLADNLVIDVKKPWILCMVGGGQDGYQLASTFAHAQLPEGFSGILITGTMMPTAEFEALQQIVCQRDDLHIIRFIPNPLALLRQAHSIIAMGGYNSTLEILSLNKRALIIPRISPRQEQWIRAIHLAQRNLVSCLHPEDLTPEALSQWICSSWQPDNPRRHLNLDGLLTFTEKMNALLTGKTSLVREEA